MDNNNNNNHWQLNKCGGATWQSSPSSAVVVAPVTQAQPQDSSRTSVSKCGTGGATLKSSVVVVTPVPVAQAQVQPQDSSRTSMTNSSHYTYPHIMQEPCSSTRSMMADPLFQTTNFNLYNSSLSPMGTPFFTLLAGPPSFSQYDSQQVLSSKPLNPSGKAHVYSSSSIVGPTQREVSFGSPKLPSQNIDNRYPKSKIENHSVVPVRTLASNTGNTDSCFHDLMQARKLSDPFLEPAKAANYHTSHGILQLNGFSSLKATLVSSPTTVQSGNLHNSSSSNQLSPVASCLTRVFCLYTSGDLFLSDSGLLGVVCSCHGFHFSIAKFSEHSGLRNVNPGDAVHIDSGESIAKWRKVYFSKFGIKIPEDQCGWHWPEGFSAAADVINSRQRAPNVTENSDKSNSVGPPRAFAASRQPLNGMVVPDGHHSTHNFGHELKRNDHENCKSPNGFTETSQSNAHSGTAKKFMEQPVSRLSISKSAGGTDNAFKPCPTYIDPIYKTKNSLTSQQSLHNLITVGKDSNKLKNSSNGDTLEKTRVSSNIELRLGQPSEQSQILGKSKVAAFSTNVRRVGNPLKTMPSKPLLSDGTNRSTEGSKQVISCAAQAAKSSSAEGQNRLGFSTLGFGAFSTKMPLQPEQLKGDVIVGSVNPLLFSHLGSPKEKIHREDSHIGTDNPHIMPKQQYAESRTSMLGSKNFRCDTDNSIKVKFGSSDVKFMGHSNPSFGFSKTNHDQSSHAQIYSNTPVDHGFFRQVTSQPISPRPPLFSAAPSMLFSSMVINSSPNITSTMSKNEANRVINSHTSSLREAVKNSNQDDVSSSRGFHKDQNVLGNPLNENLRSSVDLPSKSTERRDGYKVASRYDPPDLATKSAQSVIASWMAGGAEKPAVISVSQETSYQIRESEVQRNLLCDPYQSGPPLAMIGISEVIGSSSQHGNCCQDTSCAHVPDKCHSWVQKHSTIRNSNLNGKTYLSAFGEPSQIRASILSASNLEKGCTLHDRHISSGKIGDTIKPNLKKVEFNAFQWKDVPSKMPETCHVPCGDQTAKFLEKRIAVNDQTSDEADKCFGQRPQKVDCMKEQVMSNISSRCSAPAQTQASFKISNGDSCTDDAQNTDCAKNFAVDEGSGIQKNWSSDDPLDSGSNSDSDGFACKIDSKNEKGFKVVSDPSTCSLIYEFRVIDSSRLKNVQNQVHSRLPMRENTSSVKTLEKNFKPVKRKRETKFKLLGTSFHASPVSSVSTGSSGQSSESLEDVYKLGKSRKELPCKKQKRIYDDFIEIPESSRGKKARLDYSKAKHIWKQKVACSKITKPVVCGRYGLISNGDTSKPAKIFSLAKILKTAKRCDPAGKNVMKKLPATTSKKSIIRESNRRSGKTFNHNEDKYHIGQDSQGPAAFSDDDPMETSEGTETECRPKGTDTSCRKRRNNGIPHSDLGTRTRRKSKQIRKRSLYELIMEGKDCGLSTISKNKDCIPQDKLMNGADSINLHGTEIISRSLEESKCKSTPDVDSFCNVCGNLNNDEMNCLLECNRCLVKVHQACYGISKIPKSHWYCRPCRENATNMVCVLCGYEGGVMTQAVQSISIVRSLLKAWNVITESQENVDAPSGNLVDIEAPPSTISEKMKASAATDTMVKISSYPIDDTTVLNSVTAGFFDSTVKQWLHMVCGLWTPGTRCPNVDTMSTFDVSGACWPKGNVVCSMCKRPGGCCIRCRVMDCAIHFHPWCAHRKGLLQSEVEGSDNDKVGFYGRCELHATEDHCIDKTNPRGIQVASLHDKETCARTEGYKGRKLEGFRHDNRQNSRGADGCMVRQEQVDAWNHINRQLSLKKRFQRMPQPVQDVEYDFRKEYARYKQSRGWKHLVVYKSGIHALGLYTSLFISQSTLVVEYVGEIVEQRVADRREIEYQSGKQLQYKSACYFFKIDKEHIIDATRKGGIARFVNHSCQPNCVAKVITVRGEKKVVFFAERDIYPGEEITYDYHFNNEDEGKKILCSCNSKNCRRYLN